MLTISQAYGHKLSCFLVNIFLTFLLGLCNELLEKPRCPAEKLMVGFGAYASTFTLTNPASCGLDGVTRGPTDLPGASPSLVPPLLCSPSLIPAGCGGGKATGGGSMVG